MPIHVKLSDIIDGMETQSDESSSYLNKKTGKIVLVGFEEMSAKLWRDTAFRSKMLK